MAIVSVKGSTQVRFSSLRMTSQTRVNDVDSIFYRQIRAYSTDSTQPPRQSLVSHNRTFSKEKFCAQALDHAWNELVVKTPANFIKWIVTAVLLALIASCYEKRKNDLELARKNVEDLDQVLINTLINIEELTAIPRMHLYEGFNPIKIEENIAEIEKVSLKIRGIDDYLKETHILFPTSIKILKNNVDQKMHTLQVANVILKAALLYNNRDFSRAKKELMEIEEHSLKELEKLLLEDKKTELNSFEKVIKAQQHVTLTGAYNMFGIILRVNAKMPIRDVDLELAARKLLKSLYIAMSKSKKNPEKYEINDLSMNKPIVELLVDELKMFCVRLSREEIYEREEYSNIISNIGFLLNQWNKPEEALLFHKTACDLSPRKAEVVNGLAYAFMQKRAF